MIGKIKKWIRGSRKLEEILGAKEYRKYLHGDIGFKVIEPNYFSNKNVLVIAPHFDDEVFAAGGTLARFADAGSKINILYLTDGARGTASGQKAKDLISVRKEEAKNALEKLGAGIAMQGWDYPEGKIGFDEELKEKLKKLISELRPSHLFIPLFSDANDDHSAAYKVAAVAIAKNISTLKDSEVWQYEIWTPLIPNRLVPIGATVEKKRLAICEHKSQIDCRGYNDGILGLNNYRGFITAELKEPAEAFFALPAERFLAFDKDIARSHLNSV